VDLARAARTHPGGVLLPPAFIVGELRRGRWGPVQVTGLPTPQAARDSLVSHLRVWIPYELDLDPGQRAVYAAAADTVEAERADEVTVAGRRFRVVRLERLVRIGLDGPEGLRPSDPDPQPPVMVQVQQSPEDGEQDEDKPIELSEDAKRLARLGPRGRSAPQGPPSEQLNHVSMAQGTCACPRTSRSARGPVSLASRALHPMS
jgi:Family of unknown function (DUF5954)